MEMLVRSVLTKTHPQRLGWTFPGQAREDMLLARLLSISRDKACPQQPAQMVQTGPNRDCHKRQESSAVLTDPQFVQCFRIVTQVDKDLRPCPSDCVSG